MQNEYDLVIIGSGAGGAPIAHEFARKGKSVLMLEKGPLILPQYQAPGGVSGFRRDEAYSTGTEKILRLDVANKGSDGYTVSCDPRRLQPDRIHACLTEIYWSKGIDLATVARFLGHSFCVGVYADRVQVALTRVITDFTTFAYLTDVYVEKEHQGRYCFSHGSVRAHFEIRSAKR